MLSHVFGAVDKTSSSFSAHGKIGNFIIIIIIPDDAVLLSVEGGTPTQAAAGRVAGGRRYRLACGKRIHQHRAGHSRPRATEEASGRVGQGVASGSRARSQGGVLLGPPSVCLSVCLSVVSSFADFSFPDRFRPRNSARVSHALLVNVL